MKKLDERQELAANKIGMISFRVMFVLCPVIIVAEMLWKGNLELVIGETIVFLAGGIICLAGNIRNGSWTKSGNQMSIFQNLLLSATCSGIFSVIYALVISRKVNGIVSIARVVVLFFIGITVLCFAVLTVMGKAAQSKKEAQEKKYMD